MPVLGAVPAPGGAAGDVDNSPAAVFLEVFDCEPAEVSWGLQVDHQRDVPGRSPIPIRGIERNGFINSGVINQCVDAAIEPI